MLKKSINLMIVILVIFGVSIAFQALLAVWISPTLSPPSSIISEPLSKGNNNQAKGAGLSLCTHMSHICGDALLVPNGQVGLGGSPGAGLKLDIRGGTTNANGGLIVPNIVPSFSTTPNGQLWAE